MKLFLKIASITFAFLLAAVVLAVNIIDPNDYKQEIQQQVKQKLNRELLITGDLSWSFYPVLGFASGEVTLKNSPVFTEKTLATIQEAALSINILPLLTGKLEVGEIVLEGAEFNLITNKDGVTNLDNLGPVNVDTTTTTSETKTEVKETTETTVATETEAQPADLSQFALSGITIKDAKLQIIDHQTGDYQQVVIKQMTLDEFAFDEQTHFSLTTLINNNQLAAEVTINMDLLVDAALTQLSLSDVTIDSELTTQSLPESTIQTQLTTALTYAIKDQQLQIDNLTINNHFSGDFISGDIAFNSENISLSEHNKLAIERIALQGELTGEALSNNQLKTSLQTQLAANVEAKTAHIDAFKLTNSVIGEGLSGEAVLAFKQLNVSDFTQIVIQQLQLTSQLDAPEILPTKIDANVTADIRYDLNKQLLNITSLTSALNDLQLNGKLSFQQQAVPIIRYTLNGNVWNLNPYLPAQANKSDAPNTAAPATPQPSTAETVVAETATPEIEPDLSILKQLDIKGDFSLAGLRYQDIKIDKITNTLIVKNGQASLSPLNINLYNGSVYLDAWVNEANGKNNYKATTNIKDITLLPLLNDAAQLDILSGKANLTLTANGQGLTATKIQQGINAKGNFKILDGEIYGINLSEKLRVFKAKLKGQTLSEDKRVKKTDFASLQGDFTVKQGIVNNQKLLMLSPVMRLDGTGTADTLQQKLDYKLGITPLSKTTESTSYADLGGVTIPLLITGPFADPSIKLDTESALKAQLAANKQALEEKAKAELKRQQEKLKEKSAEEIKDKLEEQLKKFF